MSATSTFNLLPWRERQRGQSLRRWRWGLLISLLCCVAGVALIDAWLATALAQQSQQRQVWQAQQQSLQAALQDAPLWVRRHQEAQQVQAQWAHWQGIQNQAGRVLRQVLALPPRGLQIERMVWRDQHLQLTGWAISAAHVQAWQDALQAQRSDWQAAVWREVLDAGVRQHRFALSGRAGS